HFLGHQNQLWEPFSKSGIDTLDVTEIWEEPGKAHHHHNPSCNVIHQTLPKSKLSEWLRDTQAESDNGRTQSGWACLVRIVWIERDMRRKIDGVATDNLDRVAEAFEQGLAQEYSASCYSGSGCLPRSESGTRSFFFCNHPKISVTWSRRDATATS